MTEQARPPVAEGDLERYPLPRLIYYLYKKAFNGTLEIRNAADLHRGYFRDGLPARCDVPWHEDVLGRVLLERGWISQEAFDTSLQELSKGGKLQGQILLAIGALTERQLIEGLCLQLRRKLNRLFQLTTGQFALYDGEHGFGVEGEAAFVRADPLWLVYQGTRNALDASRLAPELARLDGMVIQLRGDFGRVRERYGFAEEDAGIVETLARQGLAIEEVFRISNIGPVQTQMLIYSLWVTEALVATPKHKHEAAQRAAAARASLLPGQIERAAAEPPPGARGTPLPVQKVAAAPASANAPEPEVSERAKKKAARRENEATKQTRKLIEERLVAIKEQNHFEVLGLERKQASIEAVRDAYFKLAKQFHPDRISGLGLDDIAGDASEIFRAINEAHKVLTNAEKRGEYEATLDGEADADASSDAARNALKAEVAFQQGKVYMRKKHFGNAVDSFAEAQQLQPHPDHQAWLAWATFSDPRVDRSKVVNEVKRQLLEAKAGAAKNPDVHYFLGEVYLALDDVARALTCFNRVMELKPRHVEAERHIRLIRMRKEKDGKKEGKGLFGLRRKK